jgi:hypothetical protein
MVKRGSSKPWLEFERIATEIQRQLAPNATISHDERIIGKSGLERKVDITVRQPVGPYPVLIAFDCKWHSRRVAVADVGAFAEQAEDIGASIGVIISNRGFTDGAFRVAASRKIILQTLQTYPGAVRALTRITVGLTSPTRAMNSADTSS